MDDKEINQITEEIGDLFQRVDRSLKRITNPFIGGEPVKSTADRNVRMNTQRSIAIRVQELSGRFRKSQREYMHRLQLQKYGSDMFPIFDEEEINGTGSSGFVSSQREKILMDMRNFEVDSRDKEIQRIAKSVVALSTVFKEVAEMVIDQGTVIDRIDYNIEQVATRTRNALKELHKAEKFQKNTRPERCIFTLLALIGICFLILVFKHSR
jgi:syntaxin 16